jgi:hypothetical protein
VLVRFVLRLTFVLLPPQAVVNGETNVDIIGANMFPLPFRVLAVELA